MTPTQREKALRLADALSEFDSMCAQTGLSGQAADLLRELAAEAAAFIDPFCPDCDHGLRGGKPCQSCGGSGLAAEPVQEPVAVVTECEACFTPDVCQLRGVCDYYSAAKLRVSAHPPQRQPLTEARIWEIVDTLKCGSYQIDPVEITHAIEKEYGITR